MEKLENIPVCRKIRGSSSLFERKEEEKTQKKKKEKKEKRVEVAKINLISM